MCKRQCEKMLDPKGDVLDCPTCPFDEISVRNAADNEAVEAGPVEVVVTE